MRSIYLTAAAIIVTGALLVVPAGSHAAGTNDSSVVIRVRLCPSGSFRLSHDCREIPDPAGVMYSVDLGSPHAADASGSVNFGRITAGEHSIAIASGVDADSYGRLHAFCSNSRTGIYPYVAFITYEPNPRFSVRVGHGSRLTCDLYFVP